MNHQEESDSSQKKAKWFHSEVKTTAISHGPCHIMWLTCGPRDIVLRNLDFNIILFRREKENRSGQRPHASKEIRRRGEIGHNSRSLQVRLVTYVYYLSYLEWKLYGIKLRFLKLKMINLERNQLDGHFEEEWF